MPQVFICYRRKDTEGHAGRLAEELGNRFGERNVFIDYGSIDGGAFFTTRIREAIASADVVFVLIGEEWAGQDSGGGRRIDRPDDVVRLEVAEALGSKADVVPVLVEGTPMPLRTDLPPEIAGKWQGNRLGGQQARRVSGRHDVRSDHAEHRGSEAKG